MTKIKTDKKANITSTVLGSGKVLISSSSEFYDDCPVCRAMKKAEEEGRELSQEELEKAIYKANTQN